MSPSQDSDSPVNTSRPSTWQSIQTASRKGIAQLHESVPSDWSQRCYERQYPGKWKETDYDEYTLGTIESHLKQHMRSSHHSDRWSSSDRETAYRHIRAELRRETPENMDTRDTQPKLGVVTFIHPDRITAQIRTADHQGTDYKWMATYDRDHTEAGSSESAVSPHPDDEDLEIPLLNSYKD